jgi:hypothetical protein
MTTHQLKCDPEPFAALYSREKRCEIRKDDRGFQIGDGLIVCEYRAGEYTGARVLAEITHIQRGYGLPDGIVALSVIVGATRDNADSSWTFL